MKIANEPIGAADPVNQNSPKDGLIEEILQKIRTSYSWRVRVRMKM